MVGVAVMVGTVTVRILTVVAPGEVAVIAVRMVIWISIALRNTYRVRWKRTVLSRLLLQRARCVLSVGCMVIAVNIMPRLWKLLSLNGSRRPEPEANVSRIVSLVSHAGVTLTLTVIAEAGAVIKEMEGSVARNHVPKVRGIRKRTVVTVVTAELMRFLVVMLPLPLMTVSAADVKDFAPSIRMVVIVKFALCAVNRRRNMKTASIALFRPEPEEVVTVPVTVRSSKPLRLAWRSHVPRARV